MPTAASASAPAAPNSISSASCTTQKICLYQDVKFNGGWIFYSASDPNYNNNYFQGTGNGLNDRASSIANYNCSTTDFYWDANQGGPRAVVSSYAIEEYLSSQGSNDQLSSHLRRVAC